MILIVTGTQFPFDRLLDIMDSWLESNSDKAVVCQAKTNKKFKNIKPVEKISPKKFEQYLVEAELVVAHAGMGTVLKCIEHKKAFILFPRKSDQGEHNNDHQLDTCYKLKKLGYRSICYTSTELLDSLNNSDNKYIAQGNNSNLNILQSSIELIVKNYIKGK